MPNKCIKDESIRILLDRREEIKNQINKLEAEYSAIENLIMRDYYHQQEQKGFER